MDRQATTKAAGSSHSEQRSSCPPRSLALQLGQADERDIVLAVEAGHAAQAVAAPRRRLPRVHLAQQQLQGRGSRFCA